MINLTLLTPSSKITTILIVVLIINLMVDIIIGSKTYALDDKSYSNGWYWGKDDKLQDENNKTPAINKQVKTIIKPRVSSQEVLNEIKFKIEESKATAILNPTIENVANYLKMQSQAVNMASNFSDAWQKAQLAYPELDYSALMPTNNYARRLIKDNERDQVEQNIAKFSLTHGILFFFKGNDKVATYQSQIIKEFCVQYNIALLPVALDGITNQYFPNARLDVGQAKKLNITITPAIIALNVKTKVTLPIAYGVLTELELKDKISNFMQGEKNG